MALPRRIAAMRLLIAEDDRALGVFLSRGLEADGHRVSLAYDGGAALEAFRREMPDLTILDLNMPVKDGEQVLEEIRLLDADLPVLVLTGAAGGGHAGALPGSRRRRPDDQAVQSARAARPLPGAAAAQAGSPAAAAGRRPGTGPAGSLRRAAPASRLCSPTRSSPCSST